MKEKSSCRLLISEGVQLWENIVTRWRRGGRCTPLAIKAIKKRRVEVFPSPQSHLLGRKKISPPKQGFLHGNTGMNACCWPLSLILLLLRAFGVFVARFYMLLPINGHEQF
jgi:hypothetical protein